MDFFIVGVCLSREVQDSMSVDTNVSLVAMELQQAISFTASLRPHAASTAMTLKCSGTSDESFSPI